MERSSRAVLAGVVWGDMKLSRVRGGGIGVSSEQQKSPRVVPGGRALSHPRTSNTLETTRERPLCSGTSAKAQLLPQISSEK